MPGVTHGALPTIACGAFLLALWPVFAKTQPAAPHLLQDETQCLALAVYWEGKTESRKGQLAIAHTVLNRTRSEHFPSTICGVISQKDDTAKGRCQFSWYCDGKTDRPQSEDEWAMALDVAQEAMQGGSRDPTGGALFFHSAKVKPNWGGKRKRLMRIGDHIFYR
jgi:N-acetylmuramoyl-L-alanine amidase